MYVTFYPKSLEGRYFVDLGEDKGNIKMDLDKSDERVLNRFIWLRRYQTFVNTAMAIIFLFRIINLY